MSRGRSGVVGTAALGGASGVDRGRGTLTGGQGCPATERGGRSTGRGGQALARRIAGGPRRCNLRFDRASIAPGRWPSRWRKTRHAAAAVRSASRGFFFRVSRVAMVLTRIVCIPAARATEVELEAFAVAGRHDALHVRCAERDRFLADAAVLPGLRNAHEPSGPPFPQARPIHQVGPSGILVPMARIRNGKNEPLVTGESSTLHARVAMVGSDGGAR